jgi:type VI secretion system secreted protein VgrG
VQYRETDLQFISRLMEEEGIHYYFIHGKDQEKLVITDHDATHAAIAAPDALTFHPPTGTELFEDSVSAFSRAEQIRSGAVTLRDFNFKKPSLNLEAGARGKVDAALEIYDYPGRYDAPDVGGLRARVEFEARQAQRATAQGQSNCMRLLPGHRFKLRQHPRNDLNRENLLTGVVSEGVQPQVLEEQAGSEGSRYSNRFECIAATVTYRAPRVTRKPHVAGAQTALVVGPAGEEIYTDEFGRVKVQFHWDRAGTRDENSSCWIRVSQLWAGAGWGAMYIPRVGHEVIVDFLEGDPDRPIIVGRVYHGTNRPPYPLPADKTRSTIKSESTPGGGGFNELRFEDKAGSEEIFLHGQKDWTIEILHDKQQRVGNHETLRVGSNRTKSVGADQSESIGRNKTINVGVNHDETIGANMTLSVGANCTQTIGAALSLTVGSTKTETVAINSAETIGAAKELTIGGVYQVTVGGAMNESVGGAKAEEIGGARALVVGGASKESVGGNRTVSIGGNLAETIDGKHALSAKEVKLSAADKFTIECGGASITLESSGKITIKGTEINIEGSGMSKFETGAILTLKGAQTRINC